MFSTDRYNTIQLILQISFEGQNEFHAGLKFLIEFVRQISMNLETSCIYSFLQSSLWWPLGSNSCKHAVSTRWPLKHAPHVRGAMWFCSHVSHRWCSLYKHTHLDHHTSGVPIYLVGCPLTFLLWTRIHSGLLPQAGTAARSLCPEPMGPVSWCSWPSAQHLRRLESCRGCNSDQCGRLHD